MKKIFSTIIFILFTVVLAYAQPKGQGFVKVVDISSFKQALAKNNSDIKTITSDFLQTKTLALLEEQILSKGKFYYSKADKIRIEYLQPYKYLMVINNGQMMVKDEQKTTKINAKGSKVLQSVNRVMIDCMSGSVFNNKDFKVNVYMNKSNYLLSLEPVSPEMKKMFVRIDVYMHNMNMDVDRLVMVEAGGDTTDMDFDNIKHNAALNESLFKVK